MLGTLPLSKILLRRGGYRVPSFRALIFFVFPYAFFFCRLVSFFLRRQFRGCIKLYYIVAAAVFRRPEHTQA